MYRAISYESNAAEANDTRPDGYLDKLVKYVPVEGLAAALPVAALATGKITLWITWFLALGIAVGLMKAQLKGKPPAARHFWPFVAIAFFAWTVGATSEFRGLFGISDGLAVWILAITAWGVPALDYLFAPSGDK